MVLKTPMARRFRRTQPGHEPATYDRGTLLGPLPGVCDGPAVADQMHDAKVRKREQAQKHSVGETFGRVNDHSGTRNSLYRSIEPFEDGITLFEQGVHLAGAYVGFGCQGVVG